MTQARIGYGTLLERRTAVGSPTDTYQLLAERVTLTGPGLSRDAPEASNMDSPEAWKEFIPGMKDGGEIQIEGNWIPKHASQAPDTGLLSEFSSDVFGHWRLTFPDGSPETEWEFDAILTNFEPTMPTDDKMTFSATLKITGKPTLS